jgi:hypothetical protein
MLWSPLAFSVIHTAPPHTQQEISRGARIREENKQQLGLPTLWHVSSTLLSLIFIQLKHSGLKPRIPSSERLSCH